MQMSDLPEQADGAFVVFERNFRRVVQNQHRVVGKRNAFAGRMKMS